MRGALDLLRRRRASLAWAVDTVAHEAFHLRGIHDEAPTECYAMQTLPRTPQAGSAATPEQARNLALPLSGSTSPELKPAQYTVRRPAAPTTEALDLRPADPVWP